MPPKRAIAEDAPAAAVEPGAGAAPEVDPWAGCVASEASVTAFKNLLMTPESLHESRAAFDDKAAFMKMLMDTAGVTMFEAALVVSFVRKKFAGDDPVYSPAGGSLPGAASPSFTPVSPYFTGYPSSAAPTSPSVASTAEQRENTEGACEIVRESMTLGLRAMATLAAYPLERAAIRAKLVSKRATDGGETFRMTKGDEESFKEHMGELCVWWGELDPPLNALVSRVNHVLANAPPWEDGGRDYMQKYLTKYNNTFPVRYDSVLLNKVNAKHMRMMSKERVDSRFILDASAKLDVVMRQLAAYDLETSLSDPPAITSGNEAASDVFGGRCRGCLEEGHKVGNCPHSDAIASKLRAAFIAGQKSKIKAAASS